LDYDEINLSDFTGEWFRMLYRSGQKEDCVGTGAGRREFGSGEANTVHFPAGLLILRIPRCITVIEKAEGTR